MLHPYRGLRSTQPQGRIRAGRSLLSSPPPSSREDADLDCSLQRRSSRLQQHWRVPARCLPCNPILWGFGAPVLMDVELLPGLFNSRAASDRARSSLHIPLACLESSPDSTCRRGLLLATLANTLRRKFCRSDLCQSPSISNQLKVYSCQFHQMLLASMESCFLSNF